VGGDAEPGEIAAEMEHSPDLLDSTGKQGSIRAVFDYSWGQLTPPERDAFGGLSVFRGGFTREAAQAVTGATLRELLGLVNKSLLSRAATNRYELHELLRQYAAEKLDRSGLTESVGQRHLEYHLSVAEQFEQEQSGPGQAGWMQRLAAEIDNVRAALAWSIASGCPQAGLSLILSLFGSGEPLATRARAGSGWSGCWPRRLSPARTESRPCDGWRTMPQTQGMRPWRWHGAKRRWLQPKPWVSPQRL